MKTRTLFLLGLILGGALTAGQASAQNVCYYDIADSQGDPTQVDTIVLLGMNPIFVATPDAATLAGCDVFFLQNESNSDYAAEWQANLAAVDAAVLAGLVMVFHDRRVEEAEANTPGLGSANCVRDFADDADINVVTPTTSITNGLAGFIDNTSLDGGSSSSHGYCDVLPAGGVNVLSNSTPSQSVTHYYPYGSGWVIYSTIPLDCYLNENEGGIKGAENRPQSTRDNAAKGGCSHPTFKPVYAPNVLQFGAELAGFAVTPPAIPALGPMGLILLIAGLGGIALIAMRR